MWLIVLLLVMSALPASADVYKCPDGKGSVRYQNMPCVGEAAPLFESAPATEPSRPPAQPAPAPAGEPSPASSRVSPPPPPPPEPAPQATIKPPAQPVDTLQFGLITDGMSEAEVLKRLGEPARIIDGPRTMTRVHTLGSTSWVESHRYTYYYPGTAQVFASYITFADGYVVGKRKVHE